MELDCCLLNADSNFDAEMLQISIDVILEHLLSEYAALMKVVWGADKAPQTEN